MQSMTRLGTICRAYLRLTVALIALFVGTAAGQQKVELPILEMTPEEELPSNAMKVPERTEIEFEGETYEADAAVPFLTRVALDDRTQTKSRELALLKLGHVVSRLRGSPELLQLVERFQNESDPTCRWFILKCLFRSQDERALSLFARILEENDDPTMQLGAAVGLAAWNIRSGVAALVALLDCPERRKSERTLSDEALITLRGLNKRKRWQFDGADEFRRDYEQGMNENDLCAREVARWSEWFAENKHRFPEYKPKPKG